EIGSGLAGPAVGPPQRGGRRPVFHALRGAVVPDGVLELPPGQDHAAVRRQGQSVAEGKVVPSRDGVDHAGPVEGLRRLGRREKHRQKGKVIVEDKAGGCAAPGLQGPAEPAVHSVKAPLVLLAQAAEGWTHIAEHPSTAAGRSGVSQPGRSGAAAGPRPRPAAGPGQNPGPRRDTVPPPAKARRAGSPPGTEPLGPGTLRRRWTAPGCRWKAPPGPPAPPAALFWPG